MRSRQRILGILIVLAISIVLLFTAVEVVAFNMGYFLRSYERNQVPRETGMDIDNLELVTREIMDYLRGRQAELNPRAVVNGKERYVFEERERLHMVDVKDLFTAGRWLRNTGLIVLLAAGLWLFKTDRRWPRRLLGITVAALLMNVASLLALVVLMLMDFNQIFTWFHLLLFDNDLWLLPESSLMIRMVPEVFFYHTALWIAGIYLGSLVGLTIFTGFLARRQV